MNGIHRNNLLALLGLLLCAAPAALWASGSLPAMLPATTRLGVAGAGVGLGLTFFLLAMLRWRNAWRAFDRNLNALGQLDPRALRGDNLFGDLPPLAANSPFAAVARRLHETVQDYCRRIQDLEHSRTALEVRCRRATTQAEQVREIFSAISDPILAVDDYRELLLANRGAEELFHFEPQPETRAIDRLVQCQRLVDLLTAVSQRKSAGVRSDEIEIADTDGQHHWYRATAAKLGAAGDGEAAAHGVVAVLRDIGDQKALQRRNAEFVSAVSHEMKTPLAGIKAYVELLVDGDAEDEATRAEFLNVISGQADRLQRLVENLLNLARIEAGVVSVSKQPRSLNELLEEALRVVQPTAEGKQIELAGELSQMYLGVLADRDMLLQAAINLLSNAIKYTHPGGRVTLRSRMADGQVCFDVQDTGVGLSEEDCRRVFEKFYRVNKDKGMAAGTGLGLPLAKHIVEDVHGGRLTVESTLGAGSTFIVALPNAGQLTVAKTPAMSRG
jgi:two-component system phosphate regulon sensor histidine kinase PhoR